MQVELVNTLTADGVRRDGALRRPPAGAPAALGLDLVICHHGVSGNFYNPSFFDPIGDALLAEGCAVLRANSRGHDRLFQGPAGLLGAAAECVDDARLDWRAWLDLAESAGFRRVALWGHSLGAVKTIYTLGTGPDPRVVCAIASSPPRFNYETYLTSPAFTADLDRARQLIAEGQPETLLQAQVPSPGLYTARTYLDKYGPAKRYDYVKHLPKLPVPLLLVLGGLEGGLNFAWLAEHGPSLASDLLTFQLIAGADHRYSGRVAELWQAARGWLERVAAPTAVR
jgi:pimeloyl-ACP methyl ester carboxylesterase